MPEIPTPGVMETAIVALSTALTAVLGLLGFQKKFGTKTLHITDNDSEEIRNLQDRCRDLENDVKNLREKVSEQKQDIKEAELRQEAFATIVFGKLDSMNTVLNEIKVAVGVQQHIKG